MRPFAVLLMLASAASCASSGSSPGAELPSPSDRIVASDNHTTYRTTVAPNAKVPLAVAPARAFAALKAVYDELGIPSGINEPANGRIGNTNFFKTRKLANEAISTYLNCGNSITGPAADNYRVYMSLVSVVRPDGNGASELETAFTAQAQNMEGTAGDKVVCGTTGRLEQSIEQSLLRKAADSQQR
jgi:hypothetical protein